MSKLVVPIPVIIGVVVVVVAVGGFFFMKGVSADPKTPRPDPKMFGYSQSGKPLASQSPNR